MCAKIIHKWVVCMRFWAAAHRCSSVTYIMLVLFHLLCILCINSVTDVSGSNLNLLALTEYPVARHDMHSHHCDVSIRSHERHTMVLRSFRKVRQNHNLRTVSHSLFQVRSELGRMWNSMVSNYSYYSGGSHGLIVSRSGPNRSLGATA